jgi:uncharacterized protein
MRILAIADPHLSRHTSKPMTIFGPGWAGHPAVFFERWRETVTDDDLVLIPGDISWAMHLKEAMLDLQDIAALPGTKVISRGNHDYWWPAISKLRAALPPRMHALQNDAIRFGDTVICGTRGWVTPGTEGFKSEDEKIYLREVERLRLTLEAARKLEGQRTFVMLHYPLTNAAFEPNGFTQLIEEYRPDGVLYGHLHGVNQDKLIKHWCGIPLHFVAADALKFVPKILLED